MRLVAFHENLLCSSFSLISTFNSNCMQSNLENWKFLELGVYFELSVVRIIERFIKISWYSMASQNDENVTHIKGI